MNYNNYNFINRYKVIQPNLKKKNNIKGGSNVKITVPPNTDALVYATSNKISFSDADLDAIKGDTTLIKGGSDITQNKASASELLSNTTLKRACCRTTKRTGDFDVEVRLPLQRTPEQIGTNPISKDLYEKFGYYDKSIKVPLSICSQLDTADVKWTPGSPQCDIFYNLYCRNALNEFQSKYGTTVTPDIQEKFDAYKPECVCYVMKSAVQKELSANLNPVCMFPKCKGGRESLYLDPASRLKTDCQVSNCVQIVATAIGKVGGNVNQGDINANMTCGNELKAAAAKAATSSGEGAGNRNVTSTGIGSAGAPASTPPASTPPASTPPASDASNTESSQATSDAAPPPFKNIKIIGGIASLVLFICCSLIVLGVAFFVLSGKDSKSQNMSMGHMQMGPMQMGPMQMGPMQMGPMHMGPMQMGRM